MKNSLGNLAAPRATQPTATVTNRLKNIQHRPELLGGFLAQTGLTLAHTPVTEPSVRPAGDRH